jgi:hypothetical protein
MERIPSIFILDLLNQFSFTLIILNMNYITNNEPTFKDRHVLTPSPELVSCRTSDDLFNISELVFIERVNDYFHNSTPKKAMHIAKICSNTFGRLIDEDMILYVLSLFQNGFLPKFNLYSDVNTIINVSILSLRTDSSLSLI